MKMVMIQLFNQSNMGSNHQSINRISGSFLVLIYLSPDSDPTPSPGFGLILDFFPGRLCLVGLKDWSGV